MYEAIFVALTEDAYKTKSLSLKTTDFDKVQALKQNDDFNRASQQSTTNTANVQLRINKAKELL